jgi:hypothetical protein
MTCYICKKEIRDILKSVYIGKKMYRHSKCQSTEKLRGIKK